MSHIIIDGMQISNKIASLDKVYTDLKQWRVYYEDPITKEKWVEQYLRSELHGGGPAQLRLIDEFPDWSNF